VLAASWSSRFDVDDANGDELDGSIVGFVALNGFISGPRNPIVFER